MEDEPLHDLSAESIFADFLARLEAGEDVEYEELLRTHPVLSSELEQLHGDWRSFGALIEHAAPGHIRRSPHLPDLFELAGGATERIEVSSEELMDLTKAVAGSARYHFRSVVDRGGMGAVLKVWDRELRRPLAMKVALAPDGSSAAGGSNVRALARFLDEAQVTGQLDHPGIVPVHELGVDADGRAFFTMKLVEGQNFQAVINHVHSAVGGWSLVHALGVLVKVCDALSYAHARGVVHRDIKPANVMVGKFGEAYLMDWGCARVLGSPDGRDLRITPSGGRSERRAIRTVRREFNERYTDSPLVSLDGEVLGTPAYMSPEQARGDMDLVGVRSDVYSIGALLYHLLSGYVPYANGRESAPALEVLHRVLQGPPAPVRTLAPTTPDELTAIADRAMMRAPEQRYESAEDLAHDLRAYLEGRVVRAHETGTWAETRKWMRRNRGLAGSLVGILLVSVLGTSAFAVKARESRRAAAESRVRELEAEAANVRARKVTDFVRTVLTSADPSQEGRRQARVSDAMEQAIRKLDAGELEGDPRTRAALLVTISTILASNGRPTDARRLSGEALKILSASLRDDHAELAEAHFAYANCLLTCGLAREALSIFDEALAMQQRLVPGDDAVTADYLGGRGSALHALGRFDDALLSLEDSLAMYRRLPGENHRDVAGAYANVGTCLVALGRVEEGLDNQRHALSALQELGAEDAQVAMMHNNIGVTLATMQRTQAAMESFDAATRMFRETLGSDCAQVGLGLFNRADCLLKQGLSSKAWPELEESLAILQQVHPGDHLDVARVLLAKGTCASALGNDEDAVALSEASLAMYRRVLGGDEEVVRNVLDEVARICEEAGKWGRAREIYAESLEMARRLAPGDSPQVATALERLVRVLTLDRRATDKEGDPLLELSLYKEVLRIRRELSPRDNLDLARSLGNLGAGYFWTREFEESLVHFREASAMLERLGHVGYRGTATIREGIASSSIELGQFEDALPELLKALEVRERVHGEVSASVVVNLYLQARCHVGLAEWDQALTVAKLAAQRMEVALPEDHGHRTKIAKLLREIQTAIFAR